MILRKSILSVVLTIAMLMPLAQAATVKAADDTKQIDVLFTHDTHSHLDSFSTIVNGEQKEVGGFAKIKTLINEKKKEDPDTLILDGGDFSMGTLIQTVYDTEAAELRMLGYLGYDVTTFGNHEFDYRSQGLANMLRAAKSSGETLPEIVVCNVDWDSMEKAGLNDGQKQIQSVFETYGVKDYVMVQKGDVKIAVVGVFGKDALECAPTCELSFKDPVEAVKETVEEIKKNEEADMIACVSHGGTWEDESKSEDELLAKAVPDLDLIISGHTHSELQKGDIFLLHIYDQVFTYEVDQIHIVEPIDYGLLNIEEGEDLCTLLTCTPYGINTERLLVRGHRIANRSGDNSRITSDAAKVSTVLVAVGIGIPLLIISFIAVDVSERVPKRKKKSKNRSKNRRRKATIQTRAKRIRTKQTSGRRR